MLSAMAAQAPRSYAMLERKVEERTHQLELANPRKVPLYGSGQPRPAAAAALPWACSSPDSRAYRRARTKPNCRAYGRNYCRDERPVQHAVGYFQARRWRAGPPNISEFPIAHLLKRIESTFAETARERGLSLRVVSSSACGTQRLNPARADSSEPGVQRSALYHAGWDRLGCRRRGGELGASKCGILVPAFRKISAEHLRRVLPARVSGP